MKCDSWSEYEVRPIFPSYPTKFLDLKLKYKCNNGYKLIRALKTLKANLVYVQKSCRVVIDSSFDFEDVFL